MSVIDTNSAGTSMELEELEPSKLIGPQQDVETVESWAERNGLTYGVGADGKLTHPAD